MFRLTSEAAVFWTGLLASVGAAVSTLEWLAIREHLREAGLFHRAGFLGSYPAVLAGLVLRLCVSLLLPLALWFQQGQLIALGAALVAQLLANRLDPQSVEGSDQMATQVFGSLFLGHLPGTELALQACLWYIAAQSCLSYFSAGVVKLRSPGWRQGRAVFQIFNARIFGHEAVARLLFRHPTLTQTLTWGAMAMECSFPLVLILGLPGCFLFLGWGIAFHLTNALIMGFNLFLWSFIATYPAILFCCLAIAS